jgi:general secretion pathway protein D
MKLASTLIITVGLTAALCAIAADPAQNTQPKPASLSVSEVGDLQTSPASAAPAAQTQASPTASEPAPAQGNAEDRLRLTFRNAPLNLVLDYLSDAAGFIINKETEVKGTVDIYSKHPVTKAEAVDLLNSALNKNGYALVQDGRILNIISIENAKTADTGVAVVSSPDDIQKSDEVVTRIIPVRHANATQLMQNLQVLLPTTATLSVNESANSLIMVATKTQIHRMLEIVHALDTSMASIATIKVFPLNYADAKQLATIIQQIYAPDASSQNQGGPRGRMFAMFARRFGGQGGQQANNNQANAAGSRVVAAADDYSNSLIVSAPADLMTTISDMVDQIDKPMTDVTEIRVFHLKNADPTELADQLSQLFPDQSQSNNRNTRGGRFRFMPPFMRFMANQNNQGTTSRSQEKNNVVAVADARTSSLIVTASTQMMPQIADMIAEIDSSAAKKEMVSAYELQYADPQDVQQVLQDLFNKNNTMRANNNTRGSMLGQNNPLTQRSTSQQNNNNSRNSGFGGSSRGGGSLGF